MISIIIPIHYSYNLSICLESILIQDEECEIICVGQNIFDDFSHTTVHSFITQYPKKVFFYLQDKPDQGSKRNFGLEKARGQFIMFVDSDDRLELGSLKIMRHALEITDSDFVCGAFERIDNMNYVYSREMRSRETKTININSSTLNYFAYTYPAPWGKLFRRSYIGDTRFPERPKAAYEDLIFYLKLIPKTKRYTLIPNIVYLYSISQSSTISNASLEKTKDFRSDLLDIKRQWGSLGREYQNLITLIAFIHVGISDTYRILNNGSININLFIKDVQNFLNDNFPNWRDVPVSVASYFSLRPLAVHVARIAYRFRLFHLILIIYNFIIKKFKRELKW